MLGKYKKGIHMQIGSIMYIWLMTKCEFSFLCISNSFLPVFWGLRTSGMVKCGGAAGECPLLSNCSTWYPMNAGGFCRVLLKTIS